MPKVKIKFNCGCGYTSNKLFGHEPHQDQDGLTRAHEVINGAFNHSKLSKHTVIINGEILAGDYEDQPGLERLCPHNNPPSECSQCFRISDIAYDSDREMRLK